MLVGVVGALLAGLMLGLYALPGKFTKDFQEENKWSLFFVLTMFVVPLIATFALMKDVWAVYSDIEPKTLAVMIVASFLWGCGVMMWGKAIDHIGLSLGFSLFIGTVILVGSMLPLGIAIYNGETLPSSGTLATILVGIAIVLFGVISNGRAGLTREADEAALKQNEAPPGDEQAPKQKSYALGIFIAVFGGLLATGFNVAFTIGAGPLGEAVEKTGNPGWMTAMAVMLPVFLSGGVVMTFYFLWQLSQKSAWGSFKTPSFGKNFFLIFIMAFFHYTASAMYAFAADSLGADGPVVVYAIFNTTCLVVAVISGIATGEWVKASPAAKRWLYTGLACMVGGVLVLAFGQTLDKKVEGEAEGSARSTSVGDAPEVATNLLPAARYEG